jgi:hypothetical protein
MMRLAKKHYESKHVLSGIVEKGVMVGFHIAHGYVVNVFYRESGSIPHLTAFGFALVAPFSVSWFGRQQIRQRNALVS